MKYNILLFLSIFLPTCLFAQTAPIKEPKNNIDLLQLNKFVQYCNIDTTQYEITSLTQIFNYTEIFKQENIHFKIINHIITYNDEQKFNKRTKITLYNTESKRYPTKKYLYCFFTTSPNNEGTYTVFFYLLSY